MTAVRLPISGGRYEVLVDAEDAHLVRLRRWSGYRSGRSVRAMRREADPEAGGRRLLTLACAVLGLPAGSPVRHLNGDTLDCTRANLSPSARRGARPARDPLDEPAPRTLGLRPSAGS